MKKFDLKPVVDLLDESIAKLKASQESNVRDEYPYPIQPKDKYEEVDELLKLLGWKNLSEEKPEIGKEYLVRWNPNTDNSDYPGVQIVKGYPVTDEGFLMYGISHYKEIATEDDLKVKFEKTKQP